MDLKNLKFLSALLVVMASFALAGCGDDSSTTTPGTTIECGAGTTLSEDGTTCTADGTSGSLTCGPGTMANADNTQCVLTDTTTPITCGTGTVLNADGTACEPDGSTTGPTCGAGTELNADGTACVPDGSQTGLECGDGTMANTDNTMCIPDCGPGSAADETTGACIADLEIVCDAGTFVSSNNTCVDWAELMRDGASSIVASADDGSTTQDDPFLFILDPIDCDPDPNAGIFDDPCLNSAVVDDLATGVRVTSGVPNSVTFPDVGSTAVLEGHIGMLGDVSGDGYDDQDFDTFTFEAQAGQLLRLSARSTGLPNPYVEILKFEGIDGSTDFSQATTLPNYAAYSQAQDFIRVTPIHTGINAEREYFLAEAGLYIIRVTDGSSIPPNIQAYEAADGSTQYWFTDRDNGTQSGGDNHSYMIALENVGIIDPSTLPDDATSVFEIAAANNSTNVLSGSVDEYGRVTEEVRLVRKDSDIAGGEAGYVTVKVDSYDSDAFQETALLAIYSSDLTETLPLRGIGAGSVLTLPLPPEGLIFSHDYLIETAAPEAGYSIAFEETVVLQADVGTTTTADDGGSNDFVITVPSGSILELDISNLGDGITPAILLSGLTGDVQDQVLSCVSTLALNIPCGLTDITTGAPLRIVRYLESSDPVAEPTIDILVSIVDLDSAEGSSFDYTITPTISVPAEMALDDTTTTATVDPGDVNSLTPVRWLKTDVTTVNSGVVFFDTTPADAAAKLDVSLILQTEDSANQVASTSGGTGEAVSSFTPVADPGGLFLTRVELTAGSTSSLSIEGTLGGVDSIALNACGSAGTVNMSGTQTVALSTMTNVVDGYMAFEVDGTTALSCAAGGSSYAPDGPDSFFIVTIPADNDLNLTTINSTQNAASAIGGGDAKVTVFEYDAATTCGFLADPVASAGQMSCLIGVDDIDFGTGNYAAELTWSNTTGADIDVLVVVDNWKAFNGQGDYLVDDDNVIDITIAPTPAP